MHKIPKKKSPARNSPGLHAAIRKKRERVRRQTADPLSLSQMANDEDDASSSDQDESDIDIQQMMAPRSEDGNGYNSDGDIPVVVAPNKVESPSAFLIF